MGFRLIPVEHDFNLLKFGEPFEVSKDDGLAQYVSVVAPCGQNYELEFGPNKREETELGHITIGRDGSFKYEPKLQDWEKNPGDIELADRIQYWVSIRGREIRTTDRLVIKNGLAKVENVKKNTTESFKRGDSPKEGGPPEGSYLLDGGDYDDARVARWLHHNAGNVKRLVILSASYSAYYGAFDKFRRNNMPRWDDIQSFVVNTKAAICGDVSDAVRAATAIFIEGGDQTRYWSIWTDTDLRKALGESVERNIPIAGTSAGMAILGGEIYLPPMVATGVSSAEAMSNPLDVLPAAFFSNKPFLDIPVLKDVYLETHFNARQRLGRTAAILALSRTANRAIMADENTALSVDANGIGQVCGIGRVYFAELYGRQPKQKADSSLTTGDIKIVWLEKGQKFNLKCWSPVDCQTRKLTTFRVDCGRLVPTDSAVEDWYRYYAGQAIAEDSFRRDEEGRGT